MGNLSKGIRNFTAVYMKWILRVNLFVSYLNSCELKFIWFYSGLDLTPYVAKETRNKIDHSLVYDLCGVITHRGNMRMGHYTCMVRLINQLDQEEVGKCGH